MPRNQNETWNDREALRHVGRAAPEKQRVKSMQNVERVKLPKVGRSYTIAGYGVVKVITASKGSVKIKYKKGAVEKETSVHPRLFNL